MLKLIDFSSEHLKKVLPTLLCDRTTEHNIIWATNTYKNKGFTEKDQITLEALSGANPVNLQPRARKSKDEQLYRTRAKAEVFTPSWICNFMNNYADFEWFGKDNVFNSQNEDNTWALNADKIKFPDGKTWQDYVLDCRLEITCGEAPYLVSRYDTITSDYILPIVRRIGLLDRKLRVVNENTKTQKSWINWAIKAFQSCYGYEYQGDSLLIARINLFLTFIDYYTERWKKNPEESVLSEIADIISWNLWQMDGFTDTIPFGRLKTEADDVLSLFGDEDEAKEPTTKPCVIKNWKDNKILEYKELKGAMGKMKKIKLFDFVIGNPPYQGENDSNGRKPPVYNFFMDGSYSVAKNVELITPARFLFNAGQTSEEWNNKMLNDEHFKVLYYEADGAKVFPGTDIKGGICISYRSENNSYGALKIYTAFPELRSLYNKVLTDLEKNGSFETIVQSMGLYKFSDLFMRTNPSISDATGKGTGKKITSKVVELLPNIFLKDNPNDSSFVMFYARTQSEGRIIRYVKRSYIEKNTYLDSYSVLVPKANGSGALGEVLSTPLIGEPLIGHSDTFLSIGLYDNKVEAENCMKYIKSKFLRVLLGICKVTQDNPSSTWKCIPLQDFTANSDIDWSKSIHEIDLQLYKKYGLDQQEIDFIEKNVKEMS